MKEPTPMLQLARSYVAAGLSPIPVKTDTSKSPVESGWTTFAKRQPNDAELERWFGNGTIRGIGICGGPASGNLAVLDFETSAAYVNWRKLVPPDTVDFLSDCPIVRTPSGGYHAWCRLTEASAGTVLARRPDPEDSTKAKTLIEVRGDGHQVLAPGCPPECHLTGRLYEFVDRGWLDTPPAGPIPVEVFLRWCDIAAGLTEWTPPAKAQSSRAPRPERLISDKEPGTDFSRRGTWEETGLFTAGWTWGRELDEDKGFIRRPGKEGIGISGSLGMISSPANGWPLFWSFSTNCHPFEPNTSYSRFAVFAQLKHNGNFSAAAKALAQAGYGEAKAKAPTAYLGSNNRTPSEEETREPEPDDGPEGPDDGPDGPDDRSPESNLKPSLPIIYFADIGPALDAADLVEGLLIEGAMSVVYGESGCGKTFWTLDLALHVAAGLTWRGREVEKCGVLYLALEGSHGIRNRIAAFKIAHGATDADFPFAVVPVALDLLNPAADTVGVIEAAKAAAERLSWPVKMIVVDTLSRALAGGNENAPEDMGGFVRNIDYIRQQLPAHVIVIHHSGKDGAKGARGHSLLRAATDTEIEISRDPGANISTAKIKKQREMDDEGEFAFRLESVHLGTNRRGKAVTSCVVREADGQARDTTLGRDAQAALNVLFELVKEEGRNDFPGIPVDSASVPESWWRERFYDRCKIGASPEAKRKAYRRAVDELADRDRVGVLADRVWLPTGTKRDKTGYCPAPS